MGELSVEPVSQYCFFTQVGLFEDIGIIGKQAIECPFFVNYF